MTNEATAPARTLFSCGRRMWAEASASDFYREDDDTCSYCGSLNADTLMARLEAGDVEVGPTDKNYKIYLENRGGELFKQTSRPSPGADLVTARTNHSKFYFQHLSKAQQQRFIELYNAKALHLGYPHHFYVLPFFMRYAAPAAT